jgi:hypothetical protein
MLRSGVSECFEAGLESGYSVIVPSAQEAMAKRILDKIGPSPGAGRLPPEPRRKRRRAKRVPLDPGAEKRICEIIQDRKGDLSWEGVVAAANREFKANWMRQTLAAHPKIKAAFQAKKAEIRKEASKPARRSNSTVEYLEHQVRSLKAENEELRSQLQITKTRMARWRQNAFTLGITLEQLDEDLQPNDRR